MVLVIVGVVIGLGSGSSGSNTTTSTPRRSTTTSSPRTTTTTPPKITSYEPQCSTSTTATSNAPGGTYAITVKATGGSVWTIITSAAGDQVFAGAVDPGAPQTFKVSGGVEVNLGAPGYAAVSVGSLPVTFPTGYQSPLVLTFSPPTSPATTTTEPATATTAAATTTTKMP